MKKFLKILSYLVLLTLLLFAGGVAYVIKNQEAIIQHFVQEANQVIKTDIQVKKIDLDFFSAFPKVSIALHDPLAFDAIPGSPDTLLKAKEIYLATDILSILKDQYVIDEFIVENGFVRLKVDSQGRNNYSIIQSDSTSSDSELRFSLSAVKFRNVLLSYIDLRIKNNHKLHLEDLAAALDLNEDKLIIKLEGDLYAHHIRIHDVPYLREKPLHVFTEMHYAKKEEVIAIVPSNLNIAGAAFLVQGRYAFKEESLIDLTVESPESNIQTLLSLVPTEYTSAIQQYKSEGKFYFNGAIKGRVDPGYSPLVRFDFGFEQASIYHPESGQRIENAYFKGEYSNGTSRNAQSSYLFLRDVKGTIGSNAFNGHLDIKNFKEPYLDAAVKGGVDLASLLKLYPLEKIEYAQGDLQVDFSIKGLLKDIQDKNRTEKVDSKGAIVLKGVEVKMKSRNIVLKDASGTLRADKNRIAVDNFSGHLGHSQFTLNGYCHNFLKFMVKEKEALHIDADFSSSFINLDELLHAGAVEEDQNETSAYRLNISPYVSFNFNSTIDSLQFRNLKNQDCLRQLKGKISLSNRFLRFQELGAQFAKGQVSFSGVINAQKEGKITIQTEGSLQGIDLNKSMYLFENFGQKFLVDQHLRGTLNSEFILHLPFDANFDLNLKELRATIHTNIVNGALVGFEPMKELGNYVRENKYDKYLKSNNFNQIEFSKLENTLTIANEVIAIPSMKIVSNVSEFTVRGEHTFDNKMDYFIEFPLVNYHKRENDELYGIYHDENSKQFIVYLQIVGTADDFKVIVDKKKTVKSAKEKVKEEIKETFTKEEETPNYIEIDTEDSTATMDFDDF